VGVKRDRVSDCKYETGIARRKAAADERFGRVPLFRKYSRVIFIVSFNTLWKTLKT
jgi:hypothetical protein